MQSAHTVPTPRIGGIGVLVATLAGLLAGVSAELSPVVFCLAVSVVPVFAAGLAEDLGFRVSPSGRLAAAAVSAVLMILIQKLWITGLGFLWFDQLFLFSPIAILLTIVWSAGMCHAVNLIDGLNGLAGFSVILTAFGLAAIAALAGDTEMATIALVLAAAVAGFVIHNWPRGGIFLGDGGAYTLGHLLAWIGILLLYRNPGVSGISVALLYFWPVADTTWAICRRRASGRKTDQPDRMHFHQVAMRALEIRFGLRGKRHVSNSLASLIMVPAMAIPVITGVAFHNTPFLSLAALVAMGAGFVGLYLAVIDFATSRNPGAAGAVPAGRSARVAAE